MESRRPARATRDRIVGVLVVALSIAALAVEPFVLQMFGISFPL